MGFPSPDLLQRPSQAARRSHVQAVVAGTTIDATLYTVTAGKVLYVTSMSVSAFNALAALGELQIFDGALLVLSTIIPPAGSGALATLVPAFVQSDAFPEPKQFSSNVRAHILAGTVTYTMSLTGYEE